MSSKVKTRRCEAVIFELANRYPLAFSLDKRAIRPLRKSIISDLITELRPNQHQQAELVEAINWYRNSAAYIAAVALGKGRRNLQGQKSEPCDYPARSSARAVLLERGQWTKNMQDRYEPNLRGIPLQEKLR